MVADLPFDVVSLIASYMAHAERTQDHYVVREFPSLRNFALVNRVWQRAFETEIYADLSIISPSASDGIVVGREVPRRKQGLTLERLAVLIFGPQERHYARRSALRRILYRVAVPHWLASHQRERRRDYDYGNAYRRGNDEAFEKGIRAFFASLGTWSEQPHPLTLRVALQAENVYTSDQGVEPGTFLIENDTLPLAPYVADVSQGCVFPSVSCILALEFPEIETPAAMGPENGISLRAALVISEACNANTLREVHFNGGYQIPATETRQILEKRQSLADSLARLPESVHELSLTWHTPDLSLEGDGLDSPPTISVQADALSAALHCSSLQLRELRIEGLAISPELFWPTEVKDQSTLLWPHLENIKIEWTPFTLPSDESLCYPYNPDSDNSLGNDVWRPEYFPNQHPDFALVNSYFDHLFGSIGKAAQRMPMLKSLLVSFNNEHEVKITLQSGQRVLGFNSWYGYAPSASVLKAWKASQDEVTLNGDWLEVQYTRWPPGD